MVERRAAFRRGAAGTRGPEPRLDRAASTSSSSRASEGGRGGRGERRSLSPAAAVGGYDIAVSVAKRARSCACRAWRGPGTLCAKARAWLAFGPGLRSGLNLLRRPSSYEGRGSLLMRAYKVMPAGALAARCPGARAAPKGAPPLRRGGTEAPELAGRVGEDLVLRRPWQLAPHGARLQKGAGVRSGPPPAPAGEASGDPARKVPAAPKSAKSIELTHRAEGPRAQRRPRARRDEIMLGTGRATFARLR